MTTFHETKAQDSWTKLVKILEKEWAEQQEAKKKEEEVEEVDEEEEEEEEPYCFKDTTIDTVENDICFCSVGGCVKPTEFD